MSNKSSETASLFHDEPMMATLFAYWDAKRGARLMPDRQDIDPAEIEPQILPHLLLSEFCDDGWRVRFRIVGTKVVERVGFDGTGKFLDELLTGSYLAYVASLHRDVWLHRAPVYSESKLGAGVRDHLTTRRIFLPISKGDIVPAMTLAIQTFKFADGYVEPTPRKFILDEQAISEIRRARIVDGQIQSLPHPTAALAAAVGSPKPI
jgi:hypothetical protein